MDDLTPCHHTDYIVIFAPGEDNRDCPVCEMEHQFEPERDTLRARVTQLELEAALEAAKKTACLAETPVLAIYDERNRLCRNLRDGVLDVLVEHGVLERTLRAGCWGYTLPPAERRDES